MPFGWRTLKLKWIRSNLHSMSLMEGLISTILFGPQMRCMTYEALTCMYDGYLRMNNHNSLIIVFDGCETASIIKYYVQIHRRLNVCPDIDVNLHAYLASSCPTMVTMTTQRFKLIQTKSDADTLIIKKTLQAAATMNIISIVKDSDLLLLLLGCPLMTMGTLSKLSSITTRHVSETWNRRPQASHWKFIDWIAIDDVIGTPVPCESKTLSPVLFKGCCYLEVGETSIPISRRRTL